MEVGYAGTNGHQYHAISDDLIAANVLSPETRTLSGMRAFFRSNPAQVATYTERNPRFIFFKQERGGPYGSIGQPVIGDVSIATDKSIFPAGAPAWIETSLGHEGKGGRQPLRGLRLDQDTGGAIRAAGRCDIYFGIGAGAEQLAGTQFSRGQLIYLVAR